MISFTRPSAGLTKANQCAQKKQKAWGRGYNSTTLKPSLESDQRHNINVFHNTNLLFSANPPPSKDPQSMRGRSATLGYAMARPGKKEAAKG